MILSHVWQYEFVYNTFMSFIQSYYKPRRLLSFAFLGILQKRREKILLLSAYFLIHATNVCLKFKRLKSNIWGNVGLQLVNMFNE